MTKKTIIFLVLLTNTSYLSANIEDKIDSIINPSISIKNKTKIQEKKKRFKRLKEEAKKRYAKYKISFWLSTNNHIITILVF